MSTHRHKTPLRGVKAIPRPAPGNPDYQAVNYTYAGQTGHVHEVVTIGGRELAKVGFDDRKIVYYLLSDLELDDSAKRGTFHDADAAAPRKTGDEPTREAIARSPSEGAAAKQ